MSDQVFIVRVFIELVRILFTDLAWHDLTEALEPTAKGARCIEDVTAELLELVLHVFWRRIVLEVRVDPLGLLGDHRRLALPDDLVGRKRAYCHRDESIKDLSFPVLVVLFHVRMTS